MLDTGSAKEAWRYINLKERNDLREELNNYLSPSPFRVKKDRIRALSLTHLQAAAWHKSDVGMSQNRVKFVISASTANGGYEKARELSERLTQLGYLNEFIPDVLMNPSYSLKNGNSGSCIQVMKEVVISASLLLVVVGDDYGKIDRKKTLTLTSNNVDEFDEAIGEEQTAYKNDKFPQDQQDFYKIGFYSELEVAMAMAAGIRCVPVAYGMKHMPTWPGTCIFSGHNTAGFIVDSTEAGRKAFESQIEAIYFETILGMSS